MRFAHLADVHIGAWRDPRMKTLAIEAFERAVTECLNRDVAFVLIAGDLFNTSVPPLDQVKRTVQQLQRLKQRTIPVYAIAGSHDYSPSGKTMLDVLEEAGLLTNVMKGAVVDGKVRLRFTEDPTGVKLAGILGRAGSLDSTYYEDLDREPLETEPGDKIFLFHTSLTELKPKRLEQMESNPVSMLPKGCKYYAGGHVHIVGDTQLPGYERIVYPGPLFPASFSELEELGEGGFYIVDDWELERVPVRVRDVVVHRIDANRKTPEEVNETLHALPDEVAERIVLLRISGELRSGRVIDVETKQLLDRWYDAGAYYVMKNTNQLTSKEFEEMHVAQTSAEEIEERVIREHLGTERIRESADEEVIVTQRLIVKLGEEKPEGEKQYEYEERVRKEARELL